MTDHGHVPITLPWPTWADFVASLQASVDPAKPASLRALAPFHVTLDLPPDLSTRYLLAARESGLSIGQFLTMLVAYGAGAMVRDQMQQARREGRVGMFQPPPEWGADLPDHPDPRGPLDGD